MKLMINNDSYGQSILTYLQACNNNHPRRVSNYRQFLKEINIEDFKFTNGFKCSAVHKFENLNK